jgi:hypothetical protein
MAVASLFASAAEGDLMEKRYVVLDDGRFTDDDTRSVVDEDAFPDAGGRVDIDGEDLGDPIL